MNEERMSYYYDAYEVYELLDKWNHRGPPITQHVVELFERNPNASKQEFVFGQTLLHKCLEAYLSKMGLIRVLVDSYPEALSKQDDNGYLPLHKAFTTTGCPPPNLEVIQLFLKVHPESILATITTSGAFPLHLACQQGCTIDVIRYLVEYFPDVLQYRDKAGKFPLDYALDNNNGTTERIHVIEYLIKSYPILLTFCDSKGMLPLHRVMKQQQGSRSKNSYGQNKIVDLLVESCPGSLLFQDKEGQTPLLQACQDNNSLSQIYSLVRNWPEQVTTQRNLITEPHIFNGEMLPSTLSSESIQFDRVKEWVQHHPDVIRNQDVQGRLPLHYAVVSSSDDVLEIVQFLVEQQQQFEDDDDDDDGNTMKQHAIAVPDHHGRLPIHYAAAVVSSSSSDSSSSSVSSNNHSQEVINYLIEKYPNGLTHVDNDGRLPWHYGDCSRQDNVFERSCELYPDLMNDTDLDLVPEEIRWDIIQVLPTE